MRILVIMAHPDDVDFWAAGTVALWASEGAQITYALVTAGDAGGFDHTPRERIASIRAGEQREAARILGVADVRFFEGYADGEVAVTTDLLRDVTRVIREVRPYRVLAQSPTRNWDDLRLAHPDHLAVGEAVARAVYPFARNPFAFPELERRGLHAWEARELWLQGDPDPNLTLDVTPFWAQRESALLAHASQHPDPERAVERLRQEAQDVAADADLPRGRYAETFRVVEIPE
jgi:LmbE family N-acetylglucosaminyl deacetylase